ncbi:MAG: TetR/AcrR family transcriptional regulator [Desulfotomaculales bacterium]
MEIRDRIIRAMKEQAGQKGFHAVTVDELAAAAGVSKRTLYRHFKSKDEVIEAVLDDLTAGIERRAQEIIAGTAGPPEKIRAIVRAVVEGVRFMEPRNFGDLQRYYPHLWEKIDRFRAERIERLREVYLEGCRLGYFREVDPDVLFTAYLAALRAVINPDFLLAHAVSLEQAFDTLVGILFYGIVRRT